jgi:dTDP-4-dehydrorhamnose 3,5-epimerase
MRFEETPLKGAFIIDLEKSTDERGYFARSFCAKEFGERNLCSNFVQSNVSFNLKRGTVRGMHLQVAPRAEAKLIRCTRGAIHDVIVDLRPSSPTFRQTCAVDLTEGNSRSLYVPEGFAHGFQTLADETEVSYLMSEVYSAEHARGFRWNDPQFKIRFPLEISLISDKDRNYPDWA